MAVSIWICCGELAETTIICWFAFAALYIMQLHSKTTEFINTFWATLYSYLTQLSTQIGLIKYIETWL